MKVKQKVLGEITGKKVQEYILTNDNGMEVSLTELGAQVLAIKVPNKAGKFEDVTLHYRNIDNIVENPLFFGAIVARCANRIANAKFTLNAQEYILSNNNNGNNLHSGIDYFHKKICKSQFGEGKDSSFVEFSYTFKHLEQGFPGDADFKVKYILSNDNSLRITYTMISSADTIFNPTAHIYWNLAGHNTNNIMDHVVQIFADKYTPINDKLIPTGVETVIGTPLDFCTKEKRIGDDINDTFEQIKLAGGFDHNFAINNFDNTERKVAQVYEPTSGRLLQIFTDLEGIQFYSGNFIKDYYEGKDGARYNYRGGFCLETQHFPNAINNPNFVSPVIKANTEAKTSTLYKFSVNK